jgi:hypothetical protein
MTPPQGATDPSYGRPRGSADAASQTEIAGTAVATNGRTTRSVPYPGIAGCSRKLPCQGWHRNFGELTDAREKCCDAPYTWQTTTDSVCKCWLRRAADPALKCPS